MADRKKTQSSPEEQVQAATDAAEEKGYLGTGVDPTPNENYTVAGVTSGAPTPETDAGAAKAAREHGEHIAEVSSDPASAK